MLVPVAPSFSCSTRIASRSITRSPDDPLDVRLPILEPDLPTAGRQANAMPADLLPLDLDVG